MNLYEELAKMLKDRDNPAEFAPVYGIIEELPEIKIRLCSKIIITSGQIKSLINLKERNVDGQYINLNKQVAMLPYNKDNQYLVLGVVCDG